MPSKAVVILVMSVLLVAALYSSSTFRAFGYIGPVTCHYLTTSHDHIGCCYSASDLHNAAVIKNYCYECVFDLNNGWGCGQSVEQSKAPIGQGVVNPLGNATIAPGTPPPGSIIKVPPGTTNALPTNNNTGTPPPPPTGLAGQQPQTQQTTGHHHKGSNLGTSTSNGNSTGH